LGTDTGIPIGFSYIYSCVWPVGVTVAALTYYIANRLFPYHYHPTSVIDRVQHLEHNNIDNVEMASQSDDKKL
jgi:cytosine/uracil/thiamine/allantoin permease